MLERNRRIRKERQQDIVLEQGSRAPTWRKLLTQAERLAIDASSWFVIALAGTHEMHCNPLSTNTHFKVLVLA